jgi:hypothetical protein
MAPNSVGRPSNHLATAGLHATGPVKSSSWDQLQLPIREIDIVAVDLSVEPARRTDDDHARRLRPSVDLQCRRPKGGEHWLLSFTLSARVSADGSLPAIKESFRDWWLYESQSTCDSWRSVADRWPCLARGDMTFSGPQAHAMDPHARSALPACRRRRNSVHAPVGADAHEGHPEQAGPGGGAACACAPAGPELRTAARCRGPATGPAMTPPRAAALQGAKHTPRVISCYRANLSTRIRMTAP